MDYSNEFPLAAQLLHLNHAGIGPWPKRAIQAVHEFAEENMRLGSLHSATWDKRIASLREMLCQLVGATSAAEIALTKNTSEGISLIAYGLDWSAGDNVVVGRQEFPSNRLAWESLAQRFDIEVRHADLSHQPECSLIALMDDKTRLLTTSSIQYATGYRMDLAQLGRECQRHGSLFCVDAIQSLGATPFDAQAVGADFVCADGHKWLLSPEGTGIFYCRKKHLSSLRLHQFGWHMTETPHDYEKTEWQPAADATRFECGSLNHLGLIALTASLELLFEIGLHRVFRKIESKVSYLIDNIDQQQFEILTPLTPEKRGGILTVRHRDANHNAALLSLLIENKVLCAKRAHGIRLSPHFYTPQSTLDRVLELLHHTT